MKKVLPITITIFLLIALVLMMMQTVTVYKVEPVSHGITTMKFYASISLLFINVIIVGGLIVHTLFFYKVYKLNKKKARMKAMVDDAIKTIFKDDKYFESSSIKKEDFDKAMKEDIFERKVDDSMKMKHEDIFGKPIRKSNKVRVDGDGDSD